ncbi:MAG: FtsQ-type POTRA domain-containing protein [Hyphomicrobiales bacterium]|nr:FtsQ-type POTRA domain-containing protein [Hyphomicrobiales bacterium]
MRNRAAERSLLAWAEAHKLILMKSGFAACVVFFALTATYGVIAGGHLQIIRKLVVDATNGLAVSAGFEVKTVEINGRENMKEADISAALEAGEGLSVFAFDTGRALKKIEESGWVREAMVSRVLPSRIVVDLTEREPFALWREGGKLAAIDDNGMVLGLVERAAFPTLPVLSGPGAAAPGKDIVQALNTHAELSVLVIGIERIVGRRWDLVLESGMRVKLPAVNFEEALANLGQVAAQNPGVFYEISEMDFRSPAQFTLKLKDNSPEARKEFLLRLSNTADG